MIDFHAHIVRFDDELPIVEWMKMIDVSDKVRDAIAQGNARRVLGLDADWHLS